MVKKISLLFLISFSGLWQINLFSMDAESDIEEISDSSTLCTKCGQSLYRPGTSFRAYECINTECKQSYWYVPQKSDKQKKELQSALTDSSLPKEINKNNDYIGYSQEPTKCDTSDKQKDSQSSIDNSSLEQIINNSVYIQNIENARKPKNHNDEQKISAKQGLNDISKSLGKNEINRNYFFRSFIKKYSIPVLVCSLIIWKYRNKIKKFLFGK